MELSIYDCYRSDTVKTSTQVGQTVILSMTQAPIHSQIPQTSSLIFSLINKKHLSCDVQDHILQTRDSMWFDSSVLLKRAPSN